MQNNGIKNFVCSFVLSMLAIVAADKLVFHTPRQVYKQEPQKFISAPHVSLFATPKGTEQKPVETSFASESFYASDASAKISEGENKSETEKLASYENIMPPPPAFSEEDFGQAHALVLDDEEMPSESNVVYAGEDDLNEIIPLEQGNLVTHQNVESADFAALSALNWLSEPVYHTNLVEDKEEIEKYSHNKKAPAEISDAADNPWVVASANRYAKNQIAVETYAQKGPEAEEEDAPLEAEVLPQEDISAIEETFQPKLLQEPDDSNKLAYKMIQNLLIPIPEDIMNDADLTPQLSYSPHEEKIREEKDTEKEDLDTKEEVKKKKGSGLFKSISSWFSKKEKDDENEKSVLANKAGAQPKTNKHRLSPGQAVPSPDDILDNSVIMPAELRLSFQPNRAEISGQSLQWLRAFADNARDHDDVYIEVRFDTTGSVNLQKKRLKLLSKIFADRGVDFRKINVVGTAREPNSLIVRNIRFKEEAFQETTNKSLPTRARTYY